MRHFVIGVVVAMALSGCHSEKSPAPETKPKSATPAQAKPTAANDGGSARLSVKHATDPDAAKIDQTPKDITVEELLATKLPADYKGGIEDSDRSRIGTFERSTYRLKGTLKSVVHRKDGDFFLVVAGKSGKTAVIEVPDPNLMKDSPLHDKVAAARKSIEDKYHPGDKAQDVNEPVTLEGVGFYGTSSKPSATGGGRPPRLMPGTGFTVGSQP